MVTLLFGIVNSTDVGRSVYIVPLRQNWVKFNGMHCIANEVMTNISSITSKKKHQQTTMDADDESTPGEDHDDDE